jgi:hypothetical protein
LFLGKERKGFNAEEEKRRRRGRREESAREGEDEEIALAGHDHGEGAAVGGDGEIAEGETVKDGSGLRLRDGNVTPR